MKFLISLSFLILFYQYSFAQEKSLPSDERGKLIYYEVVEMKKVPADSLKMRVMYFMKKNAKFIQMKSETDTTVVAAGKMIINKTALVLSRPSGEVRYNFYAEMRNEKYRFWLTDYEFIPYERDRYGNFVPSTSIGAPLERKPGKLNAGEWNSYLSSAATDSKALAEQFKKVMSSSIPTSAPRVVKKEHVITTKTW